MKKILIIALVIVAGSLLALPSCKSSKKLGGMVEGDTYNMEVWIDDNTIRVHCAGVSTEGLTNDVQKKKTALKAAQLDGTYTIIEKFCGSQIEGAAGMKNYELTGIAISQELKAKLRSGSIKNAKCSNEPDEQGRISCEGEYEISSPGLKKKMKLECK